METKSTRKKAATSRSPINRHVDPARLVKRYRFSVEDGDLLWLDGHLYVSHSGLIRLARRSHCAGTMSSQLQSSQIRQRQGGHSKPRSSSHEHAAASLGTATPIRPTSPR